MRQRGGGSPPESPQLSAAEVAQLWASFRAGELARCPRDAAPVALAVDGAAKAYRLVCTECGLASAWFGASPSGLVYRGTMPTVVPGDHSHDE